MLDVAVLYEEYRSFVFNYIRRRVRWRSVEDAEDLTQVVFERAFRRAETYEDRGLPPQAWLARIARNVLVDFAGSEQCVRRRGEYVPVTFVQVRDDLDHADDADDPADLVGRYAPVVVPFDRLTDLQRETLRLRYRDQLEWSAVGERTGSGCNGAKKAGQRALLTLRRLMGVA